MSKTYFLSQIFNNYNKVKMPLNTDIGYDVIQNQNQIFEPPNDQKRSDIYFINKSSNNGQDKYEK